MVVLVCLPEIGYEHHFSNPQIRCELFLDYPIYGYCSIQPYCPCVSLAFAVEGVEYNPVDAGFDKRYFRHVCHESVVSPVGRGLALRLCGPARKGIIYESIGIYGFRPSLRYGNARDAYVCGIHGSNEAVPSIFE